MDASNSKTRSRRNLRKKVEKNYAEDEDNVKDTLVQLAEAEVDEIEIKPDLTLLDEPEVNYIMKNTTHDSDDPLAGFAPGTDIASLPQIECTSKRFTIEDLTCKFCSRVFQYPWIVQVHMNTHTGKRPYKCEFCGKCFSSSGTLSNHRTIHKQVKPFECGYCDKSFGRRYQLQTHELIHTGEKGYHRCQRCNESFRKKHECVEHEMTCTRTERVQPQIRYGKLKRRRQKRLSQNDNSNGSSSTNEQDEDLELDVKVNMHLDIEIKEGNQPAYY